VNATQPEMAVTNGKVRGTELGYIDIEANKEYPLSSAIGKDIGNTNATESQLEAINVDKYYLIYFYEGDKYLVLFHKKPGDAWYKAKQCTFWKATESP